MLVANFSRYACSCLVGSSTVQCVFVFCFVFLPTTFLIRGAQKARWPAATARFSPASQMDRHGSSREEGEEEKNEEEEEVYLSLLNLRECKMAGIFCLRFHRWMLSSAKALTSAPWRNREDCCEVILPFPAVS